MLSIRTIWIGFWKLKKKNTKYWNGSETFNKFIKKKNNFLIKVLNWSLLNFSLRSAGDFEIIW